MSDRKNAKDSGEYGKAEEFSVWHRDAELPHFAALSGNLKTEVAIIGGGLVGLLTAYELMRQGKKAVVLEAVRVGSGQTEGTTAKITSQHGLIYDKLTKNYGFDAAWTYAAFHQQMIDEYEKLIQREQIACDFRRTESWLYTCEKETRLLHREAEVARALGIPATYETDTPLPFAVTGAVRFAGQAQFHPLKFLAAIAKKLTIYEDTRVEKVHGHQIRTNRGVVTAKHIVFACHYPFVIAPGWYPLRMSQKRSYVLAVKNVPQFEGMYYGIGTDELSYRFYGDILLAGGGGHRTGEQADCCGFRHLETCLREKFPEAQVVGKWSAQDCITHDDLPFVGKFSLLRPYWHVAAGLKKWGMTGAMACAKILSAQICGVEEMSGGAEEQKALTDAMALFKPQRLHFLAGMHAIREHVAVNAKGLTAGNLLRRKPRCPHMGSELVWNGENRTWECPCHGSRFDKNGMVLDGPAQTEAEVALHD